ncbi:MAG: methyltransferase domain-containing protein [Candidatus Paceibacterota bacterium]
MAISFGNVENIDELELPKDFNAVWANNLFEHLLAPHAFLMKLKTAVNDNALLILGVPVIPKISTLLKVKKFRGSLSSAHINFFTRESLRLTAERAGWKIVAVRPFIFTSKLLDFFASFIAPHLYVVAKNDSKFIYPPKKVNEWEGDEHYAKLLKIGGVKK